MPSCTDCPQTPLFIMARANRKSLNSSKTLECYRTFIQKKKQGEQVMERIVTVNQGAASVGCIISQPECGPVRRVVLGVHGFTGSAKDDIQENVAQEMCLFGSACVRFDFPAHGESPVDTLTLSGCVDTLYAAACCAKEQFPEVEDLCIFATGFGAYVTLLALQDLKELPGRLRLVIQTPAVLMHETLLSMLQISRETFRSMDKVVLPTPRPLEVTYSFYEDALENLALMNYNMPILILHSEKDDYTPMEHIQAFHQMNDHTKLVVIPGATHRFQEDGAWDMVLDLTRDWFEFEQILLSDWF